MPWVTTDGLVAWRTDEYVAAQRESRKRRAGMDAIRTVHSYTPTGSNLIDGHVGLVLARCLCGWEHDRVGVPETAATAWRLHLSSVDAPRTWRS